MKNYLFLSWFYSTKYFNLLLLKMVNTGQVCSELENLFKKHSNEIFKLRKMLKTKNIRVLTYVDSQYPLYLKNLEMPPWVISTLGKQDLLESFKKLSIVGSRKPDSESKYWLHQELGRMNKGVVVVSGGAIGIDQAAHRSAYMNKISGICVLPVGILEMYPRSLGPLVDAYLKTGEFLVVSQFHPNKKVCKSSFYPRNYLISALSNKVLIVQAAEKSGTMVTAKYAIEMGRDLYSLPASPWDSRYGGNLKLLEDGAYQIIDLRLIHL